MEPLRSGSKKKTVMVSLFVQCCYSVFLYSTFFFIATSDAKKNLFSFVSLAYVFLFVKIFLLFDLNR